MRANDLIKHIAAGVAGGLVGTLAMNYYWKAAAALEGEDPRSLTADDAPDTLDEISAVGKQREQGESSTAAIGRKVHETIAGDEPSSEEKATLSSTVHWTYGSLMGGAYGALRGPVRGADLGGGAAFGTAMWALGDELMVPLLGLSKGPTAYPLKQHLHRFGAHLVYGSATALTTHLLLGDGSVPSLRTWGWGAAKLYARWRALKAAGQGAQKVMVRLAS